MAVKTEKSVPPELLLVKVFAALAPATLANHFFPGHVNLTYGLGLPLGIIPAFFIPVRPTIKQLPFLVAGALLAGAICFFGPQ